MTSRTGPSSEAFSALERCKGLAERLRGFERPPERISACLTAATR